MAAPIYGVPAGFAREVHRGVVIIDGLGKSKKSDGFAEARRLAEQLSSASVRRGGKPVVLVVKPMVRCGWR